jgi:hypothetical protein
LLVRFTRDDSGAQLTPEGQNPSLDNVHYARVHVVVDALKDSPPAPPAEKAPTGGGDTGPAPSGPPPAKAASPAADAQPDDGEQATAEMIDQILALGLDEAAMEQFGHEPGGPMLKGPLRRALASRS